MGSCVLSLSLSGTPSGRTPPPFAGITQSRDRLRDALGLYAESAYTGWVPVQVFHLCRTGHSDGNPKINLKRLNFRRWQLAALPSCNVSVVPHCGIPPPPSFTPLPLILLDNSSGVPRALPQGATYVVTLRCSSVCRAPLGKCNFAHAILSNLVGGGIFFFFFFFELK